MRLINTGTLELCEFVGHEIPSYAILSHTWSDKEVTFEDWADRASASTKDYDKIINTCGLAKSHGYDYVWVDTNCINKSSSAELTEAINSMFMWYQRAGICYAYLVDVPSANGTELSEHLTRSRWFTRGWTLQELLAPQEVEFYSSDWTFLGTKASLCSDISSITGISVKYLCGDPYLSGYYVIRSSQFSVPIGEASVAERMSWGSLRTTTRTEDMAYCMLGIFDINMPLLYGEGTKAFTRLQEEIMKVSNDYSLFCWTWSSGYYGGFLALSPMCFRDSKDYIGSRQNVRPTPYFMTNAGLSVTLPVLRCWTENRFICVLPVESSKGHKRFGIPMFGDLSSGRVCRTSRPHLPIPLDDKISTNDRCELFISENYSPMSSPTGILVRPSGHPFPPEVLLTFEPPGKILDIQTFPRGRFSPKHSILRVCGPSQREQGSEVYFGQRQRNPLKSSNGILEGTLLQLFRENQGPVSLVISLNKGYNPWRWSYFWVSLKDASELQSGEFTPALRRVQRALQDGANTTNIESEKVSGISASISPSNTYGFTHMHLRIFPPDFRRILPPRRMYPVVTT